MIAVFIVYTLSITALKLNLNVGRVSDSVTRQNGPLNVGLRYANPTYLRALGITNFFTQYLNY